MISVYAMLFFASFGIGCWCWYHYTHSWTFGDDWSDVSAIEEPPVTQAYGVHVDPQRSWGESWMATGRKAVKDLTEWMFRDPYPATGDDNAAHAFVFRSDEQKQKYLDALKRMDKKYGQEIEDAIRRAEEKKRLHDEGKDNPPLPRPDSSIGRTYR